MIKLSRRKWKRLVLEQFRRWKKIDAELKTNLLKSVDLT